MNFNQVRVVLVAPRLAANVGSAARAMKTMGFTNLVLVNPRDYEADYLQAVALASGAVDVLEKAQIVSSLSAALNGSHWAVGFTARPREWGGSVADLPATAQSVIEKTNAAQTISLVFGNERTGLSNEEVQACQHICQINTNPEYGSLNLAQAVQLAAYALRQASLNSTETSSEGSKRQGETPATLDENAATLEHLLQAMTAVDYFNPQAPRKTRERLGGILQRAALSSNDAAFLRGLAAAILKTKA